MLQFRVHPLIIREVCARVGFGRRCMERMVEYDQSQRIVSECDT